MSAPAKKPTWSDFNRELGRIRVLTEGNSWLHVIEAERKSDGGKFLRLAKYLRTFNIRSPQQLGGVIIGLEEAAEEIGWQTGLGDYLKGTRLVSEKKGDTKESQKLRERLKKARKRNMEYRETIDRLEVSSFKEDLRDFQAKLKANVGETGIHKWLEERMWVFGSEYLHSQPISCSEVGWVNSRFDFFLQRYDSFFDIIELKSPTSKLFKRSSLSKSRLFPSRESPISADLQKAISQMIGYLETATLSASLLQAMKGIYILKPKGIIVIGRNTDEEVKAKRTLNSYLHTIEVLTYDDLYAKAREFIQLLNQRKPRPMVAPKPMKSK
jgi:hypothetical protein